MGKPWMFKGRREKNKSERVFKKYLLIPYNFKIYS